MENLYLEVDRKEYQRQYYQRNKRRLDALHRKWREKHPARYREILNGARMRLKAQKSDFLLPLRCSPCADCGKTFPPLCMDFDHLPGFKKMKDIGKLMGDGSPMEVLMTEVKKCELVCACCHRLRTYTRNLTK